ncbi:hypothetical protein EP12_11785 [Alteromonas australica]|nr:hypothetical protein EP12_11785 [Alteromonas australica]
MRVLVRLLVLVIVVVSAVIGGITYVEKEANTPLLIEQERLFVVDKGMSGYGVVYKLTAEGLTDISPTVAKLWLKFLAPSGHIKSGTYLIEKDASFASLIALFALGQEHSFPVSLVEGLTLSQWIQTLKQQENLVFDISDSVVAKIIASSRIAPDTQHGEGLFLADTYFYNDGDKASVVLQRAHDAMRDFLSNAWQQRQADLPLSSPYEALILASIIEKETAVPEERGKIAGVFVNRLMRNMRLQTDPTVIYGIGAHFDGNITRKHLRTPTPYNTYVIKGLPPTPIAMAGKEAILAALNPMQTDALYFVANGDGSHVFSSSLEAHNQAVRKYQLNQK